MVRASHAATAPRAMINEKNTAKRIYNHGMERTAIKDGTREAGTQEQA